MFFSFLCKYSPKINVNIFASEKLDTLICYFNVEEINIERATGAFFFQRLNMSYVRIFKSYMRIFTVSLE